MTGLFVNNELERVLKESIASQFEVITHLPVGTEEIYETFQSCEPVSRPRFETGISRYRSRFVTYSTTVFGVIAIDSLKVSYSN
jgi:hypothetical protein